MLSKYPVQLCQFHQVKNVVTHLTKRPELEASKELLTLVYMLCHTDKESFIGRFEEWVSWWDSFLKERSRDAATGKTRYTHSRLRSAYLGLKRNMKLLWTWYDNPMLRIPNTNNALESLFADLKTKLRVHNGLSVRNRRIFIDNYFLRSFKNQPF